MNKSYLELGFATILFASFGVFARLLSESFSDIGQTLVRAIVALIVITVVVVFKRLDLKLSKKQILIILSLAVFVACSMFLFTVSINQMKISNAIFLLYAGSIFGSIILGSIFFKEKLTILKISVIFLTLFGLFIFAYPLNINSANFLLIGISAGIFDVLGNFTRKILKGTNKLVVLFYQYLFACLIFVLITFTQKDTIINSLEVNSLLIIVYGALILYCNWLLHNAFRKVELTVGTIILSLEILFTIVFGFIFFQEVPSVFELIGGVLILISFQLLNLKFKSLGIISHRGKYRSSKAK